MGTNQDTKGLMPETVPVVPDPDREAALVDQLNRGEGNLVNVAVELADLCGRTGRQQFAISHLERVANALSDSDARAYFRLLCGQMMEQVRDYESARDYYERGLAEPTNPAYTRYFLHNNLGFCLNELGRHKEAESHCHEAVEIAPKYHNAYKNLAIALEYMNDWPGAAFHFAAAAQLAPSDRRALMHLNTLLEAHPEVYEAVEDLRSWHEELLSHDRNLRERMN